MNPFEDFKFVIGQPVSLVYSYSKTMVLERMYSETVGGVEKLYVIRDRADRVITVREMEIEPLPSDKVLKERMIEDVDRIMNKAQENADESH